jgi:hypothetical protein
LKQLHIKYWVQAKERGNTQFKIILTHNLCDGVRPISEWFDIPMGGCEVLFSANETTPYHQPETCVEPDVGHVVACTWNWISTGYHEPIVGCVGSIQKFGCSIYLSLSMGGLFL